MLHSCIILIIIHMRMHNPAGILSIRIRIANTGIVTFVLLGIIT